MRYHQWDGWRLLCTIACCVFHCFPHGWFFEWHLIFYYGTLTIWLEYICKSHWFHPELPWVYFYSFQIFCLSEPPSFQGSLITCSTCISACADGALWQMAIDLLQEVEVCNPWRRMTDGGAMGEPLGVFSAWGLWTKHEQNYFFRGFLKGIVGYVSQVVDFSRAKSSKKNHEMMMAWNHQNSTFSPWQHHHVMISSNLWKSWVWMSYGSAGR